MISMKIKRGERSTRRNEAFRKVIDEAVGAEPNLRGLGAIISSQKSIAARKASG